MKAESELQLCYWNIRGLGARLRLLLQYTQVPYKQRFYTPQTRPKWFEQEKLELIKKNPCITLPFIKDEEQLVSQSDACAIYIIHKSKKVQLLGRNSQEQVTLATAMGVFKDFYKTYLEIIYGPQTKQIDQLKEIYIQKFSNYLGKLDGLLQGKEYYCGQITYVDFFIAEFVEHLNLFIPSLFQTKYKNVIEHQKRIWNLPAIKKYIESDRWIQRPVNYVIGRWK